MSEFSEGIGSRRAPFFLLLRPPLLFSFPDLGDFAGDRRVCCPLSAFGLSTVDGELLDPLDFALSWLTGGKLWKRQKMWQKEARSFAAMTRHSGPDSPFWQYGRMCASVIASPSRASQMMWWYSLSDLVSRVLSSFRSRLAFTSFLDSRIERPRTWKKAAERTSFAGRVRVGKPLTLASRPKIFSSIWDTAIDG